MGRFISVCLLGLMAIAPLAPQGARLSDILQGKAPYTDLLHGFSAKIPQGWSVQVHGPLVSVQDGTRFIFFCVARYNGNLKEVAQRWIQEQSLLGTLRGRQPRYAFRVLPQGVLIVGEGLSFPTAIDPMASIEWAMLNQSLPSDYQEITAFLPGKSVVLIASLLFPADTDAATLRTMLETVQSFRFLPLEQRISWRQEVITDPPTGMPAVFLHVPEGFTFSGSVVLIGTSHSVAYLVQKGNAFLRQDTIALKTDIMQNPLTGQIGTTVLNINGQDSLQRQPLFVRNFDDAVQFLLGIWRAETGQEWRLQEKAILPLSAKERASEAFFRQQLAQLGLGFQLQEASTQALKGALTATSGSTVRCGFLNGFVLFTARTGIEGTTQKHNATLITLTVQAPETQMERMMGIAAGVLASLRTNPNWLVTARERSRQWNMELDRMARERLEEHNEFLTRKAIAWANVLSDQTFVKDPETGEIFRVQREGGEFWRHPILGNIIGGVEKGTELADILRLEGWRPMLQSLEGFPEQWK